MYFVLHLLTLNLVLTSTNGPPFHNIHHTIRTITRFHKTHTLIIYAHVDREHKHLERSSMQCASANLRRQLARRNMCASVFATRCDGNIIEAYSHTNTHKFSLMLDC